MLDLKKQKKYDIIIIQKEREITNKANLLNSTERIEASIAARLEKLKKFCYNIFTKINKILRDTRRNYYGKNDQESNV